MSVRSTATVALSLAALVGAAAPSRAVELTQHVTKVQSGYYGPKPYYGPSAGAIAAGVAGGMAVGVLAASAARATVVDNGCDTIVRRYYQPDGSVLVRHIPRCD